MVVLAVGIGCLIAAFGVREASYSYSVQPGGPACVSGSPCNNMPWYHAAVYNEMVDVAILLGLIGLVILAAWISLTVIGRLNGNRSTP